MAESFVRHAQGSFTLDVAWTLRAREALAVFGPSGSGKTTLLRAIAGLLRPLEGHIVIDGEEVFDSRSGLWIPAHRRRVGYMPQSYGLFPHLRVRENVAFGLRGRAGDVDSRRVDALLAKLHILEFAGRYPATLSSGQQQRVALARALAPGPRLLLLDEPFSALDEELRRGLRAELRRLRDEAAVPLILVTHDWADVLALTDRVLVLDAGRVVAEGPPIEVLRRPQAEVLSRTTAVENILAGRVTGLDPSAGIMTCDLGGVALAAPYADLPVGAPVKVGIRAGDIILATEPPRGLSARNILQGRVVAVRQRGFEREVLADCGQPFLVEITPRAEEKLRIAPGQAVWLVIKSNSCFLIE